MFMQVGWLIRRSARMVGCFAQVEEGIGQNIQEDYSGTTSEREGIVRGARHDAGLISSFPHLGLHTC